MRACWVNPVFADSSTDGTPLYRSGGSYTHMEDQEKTFEDSLARLEEIVRVLESGESNLDDSLASFEEGVQLARACLERLKKAELRVQELRLDE